MKKICVIALISVFMFCNISCNAAERAAKKSGPKVKFVKGKDKIIFMPGSERKRCRRANTEISSGKGASEDTLFASQALR